MKLLIFGASGSVGFEIVKQALQNGYVTTAFVRDPEKLRTLKNPRLRILQGDVTDPEDVEGAMKDQDAVLCAIGDGRIGKVRAIGTKHIVEGMKKSDIKKLICQTTLGLGESYGNLNFIWKHVMFGFLLKKAFRDHKLQEQILTDCDLDYIIVRPSALTHGTLTHNYKKGFDGSYKDLDLKISRADVADFMLAQVDSDRNVQRDISISN